MFGGNTEHQQQYDGGHDADQDNTVDGKRSALEQDLRG